MDLGEFGTNAGSGLLGVLLGYLGIAQRVKNLETGKVDTTACSVCASQNKERHDEVMKALAEIREDLKRERSRTR